MSVDTDKTILVIDDNDLFREAIKDILELDNIGVYGAATGQDGLNIFYDQNDTVDAILLDVHLPDLSFDSMVEQLRGISQSVPLIVSSGHSWSHIMKTYEIDPDTVTGHLGKPFDAMTLSDLLKGYI